MSNVYIPLSKRLKIKIMNEVKGVQRIFVNGKPGVFMNGKEEEEISRRSFDGWIKFNYEKVEFRAIHYLSGCKRLEYISEFGNKVCWEFQPYGVSDMCKH